MPWTESRTRDEWLAEVRRRGERMRRRRRMALSAVGALALVLPMAALASMTGGDPDPDLRVTAAGPGPAREAVGDVLLPLVETTVLEAEPPGPTIVPGGSGAEPGWRPSIQPAPPTTVGVHARAGSASGATVDEPVVRSGPATTVAAGRPDDSVSSSPAQLPPNGSPPTTDPSLTTCPTSHVTVTVTPGRQAYGPGERVTWSSTITNTSATTCLMSGRAFFHVEDNMGNKVGQFAHTADFQMPVKAEPGKSITNSHSWDQQDCSGSTCRQVPPGRYTVVAAWTEAAPYVGSGSFDIGG